MRPITTCLLLAACSAASAQTIQTDAYATSAPANQIWKNPYGLCWRTSAWTPEKAIAECDPDLVKPAPRAEPVAPAPTVAAAPPPPPVVAPPAPPPPAPVVAAPAAPAAPAPAPVPDVVVLKGVNFKTGSAELTPESSSVLD